jgi:hypothetical protein
MDNKLTKDKLRKLNTYTSLNRPYIPDYNQPDKSEIYSTFTNSDYNTILQKINDTNILNFKNEDRTTLIHAIIQNTTITEDKKINIIKELIKKNLTINVLNKYNESPLHYAAKNGNYYVFEFLLKNNADYTIIDNNGNTALHYMIDHLVIECDDNDMYDYDKNFDKKFNKSNFFKRVNSRISLDIMQDIDNKILINNPNILKDILKLIKKNDIYNRLDISLIIEETDNELSNLNKNIDINKENKLLEIYNNTKKKLIDLFNKSVNYDITNTNFFNFDFDDKNMKNNLIDNHIDKITKDTVITNLQIKNDIQSIKSVILDIYKDYYETPFNFLSIYYHNQELQKYIIENNTEKIISDTDNLNYINDKFFNENNEYDIYQYCETISLNDTLNIYECNNITKNNNIVRPFKKDDKIQIYFENNKKDDYNNYVNELEDKLQNKIESYLLDIINDTYDIKNILNIFEDIQFINPYFYIYIYSYLYNQFENINNIKILFVNEYFYSINQIDNEKKKLDLDMNKLFYVFINFINRTLNDMIKNQFLSDHEEILTKDICSKFNNIYTDLQKNINTDKNFNLFNDIIKVILNFKKELDEANSKFGIDKNELPNTIANVIIDQFLKIFYSYLIINLNIILFEIKINVNNDNQQNIKSLVQNYKDKIAIINTISIQSLFNFDDTLFDNKNITYINMLVIKNISIDNFINLQINNFNSNPNLNKIIQLNTEDDIYDVITNNFKSSRLDKLKNQKLSSKVIEIENYTKKETITINLLGNLILYAFDPKINPNLLSYSTKNLIKILNGEERKYSIDNLINNLYNNQSQIPVILSSIYNNTINKYIFDNCNPTNRRDRTELCVNIITLRKNYLNTIKSFNYKLNLSNNIRSELVKSITFIAFGPNPNYDQLLKIDELNHELDDFKNSANNLPITPTYDNIDVANTTSNNYAPPDINPINDNRFNYEHLIMLLSILILNQSDNINRINFDNIETISNENIKNALFSIFNNPDNNNGLRDNIKNKIIENKYNDTDLKLILTNEFIISSSINPFMILVFLNNSDNQILLDQILRTDNIINLYNDIDLNNVIPKDNEIRELISQKKLLHTTETRNLENKNREHASLNSNIIEKLKNLGKFYDNFTKSNIYFDLNNKVIIPEDPNNDPSISAIRNAATAIKKYILNPNVNLNVANAIANNNNPVTNLAYEQSKILIEENENPKLSSAHVVGQNAINDLHDYNNNNGPMTNNITKFFTAANNIENAITSPIRSLNNIINALNNPINPNSIEESISLKITTTSMNVAIENVQHYINQFNQIYPNDDNDVLKNEIRIRNSLIDTSASHIIYYSIISSALISSIAGFTANISQDKLNETEDAIFDNTNIIKIFNSFITDANSSPDQNTPGFIISNAITNAITTTFGVTIPINPGINNIRSSITNANLVQIAAQLHPVTNATTTIISTIASLIILDNAAILANTPADFIRIINVNANANPYGQTQIKNIIDNAVNLANQAPPVFPSINQLTDAIFEIIINQPNPIECIIDFIQVLANLGGNYRNTIYSAVANSAVTISTCASMILTSIKKTKNTMAIQSNERFAKITSDTTNGIISKLIPIIITDRKRIITYDKFIENLNKYITNDRKFLVSKNINIVIDYFVTPIAKDEQKPNTKLLEDYNDLESRYNTNIKEIDEINNNIIKLKNTYETYEELLKKIGNKSNSIIDFSKLFYDTELLYHLNINKFLIKGIVESEKIIIDENFNFKKYSMYINELTLRDEFLFNKNNIYYHNNKIHYHNNKIHSYLIYIYKSLDNIEKQVVDDVNLKALDASFIKYNIYYEFFINILNNLNLIKIKLTLPNETKIFNYKELLDEIEDESMIKYLENIRKKSYTQQINKIYSIIKDQIFDKITKIINYFNEFQGLVYLKKKNDSDYTINTLYSNNINFNSFYKDIPKTFDDFFNKYKNNNTYNNFLPYYYLFDINKIYYSNDEKQLQSIIIKLNIDNESFSIKESHVYIEINVINEYKNGYTQYLCKSDNLPIKYERNNKLNNFLFASENLGDLSGDSIVKFEELKNIDDALIINVLYNFNLFIEFNVIDIYNLYQNNINIILDDIIEKQPEENKLSDILKESIEKIKENETLKKHIISENIMKLLKSYIDVIKNSKINELLKMIFKDQNINIQLNPKDIEISKILEQSKTFDINISKPEKNSKNTKLIIKCYKEDKLQKLIDLRTELRSDKKKDIDFRIKDLDGNTILNRLVDQFNLCGFNKILEKLPSLWTYKNKKNQNCKQYILNNILLIKEKYNSENLNLKFSEYGDILKHYINSNDFGKLPSNKLNFEITKTLINECITEFSKYIFNNTNSDKKIDELTDETSFIIKLFESNYNEFNDKKIKTFSEFFNDRIEVIFNDYSDLDKYEDSFYNTTNQEIINIIKNKVINQITNDFENKIKINFTQDSIGSEKIKEILYKSMINKLNLQDPEKNPLNSDIEILETNLLRDIVLSEEDKIILKDYLKYYKTISDYICEKVYNEINDILFDLKKMSIFIQMLNGINQHGKKI